jgi:hypothetical protein
MSAVQLSPTAPNNFTVKEISFSLSSVHLNASDGEFGYISYQSSSSKHRARHSLLKELNLASFSELTPRKRKLYEHIWNKESALCKLKKKYKRKKLKELCDMESDPLMESLSFSFSVELPVFWQQFLGTVDRGLRAGGGILKTKCWLCLSVNVASNPISFSVHYSPSHANDRCNLS